MAIELQELVKAGVYPDADTAVQEALRVLWQERPRSAHQCGCPSLPYGGIVGRQSRGVGRR